MFYAYELPGHILMSYIVACCRGSLVSIVTLLHDRRPKKKLVSIPSIGKCLSSPQGPDWLHGPVFAKSGTGALGLIHPGVKGLRRSTVHSAPSNHVVTSA